MLPCDRFSVMSMRPIPEPNPVLGERRTILFQFLKPPCEEPTLWLAPNQGQRLLIRITRLRKPSQPAAQLRAGGVREMVAGEFLAGQQGVDETKPLLRPLT